MSRDQRIFRLSKDEKRILFSGVTPITKEERDRMHIEGEQLFQKRRRFGLLGMSICFILLLSLNIQYIL